MKKRKQPGPTTAQLQHVATRVEAEAFFAPRPTPIAAGSLQRAKELLMRAIGDTRAQVVTQEAVRRARRRVAKAQKELAAIEADLAPFQRVGRLGGIWAMRQEAAKMVGDQPPVTPDWINAGTKLVGAVLGARASIELLEQRLLAVEAAPEPLSAWPLGKGRKAGDAEAIAEAVAMRARLAREGVDPDSAEGTARACDLAVAAGWSLKPRTERAHFALSDTWRHRLGLGRDASRFGAWATLVDGMK